MQNRKEDAEFSWWSRLPFRSSHESFCQISDERTGIKINFWQIVLSVMHANACSTPESIKQRGQDEPKSKEKESFSNGSAARLKFEI